MLPSNKIVYIKAPFKPVGKNVTIKVPTGEKKKGFFGKEKDVLSKESRWEQTGWSDCEIDGEKLSEDLSTAIDSLNREGYEVVSILPIISGKYAYKYQAQGISSSQRALGDTEKVSGGASYGFGYGYSYTEGVSIVARRVS
ncbi:hypothetical protein [Castellaniella sp.]|uniref:hypothetical protein n=1 Tax=Castellaniella sp. TaxID=1955812 RepID=UPI002AFFE5A0|nr:hypothetical protein [Castellaniella sp.]